MRELNLLLPPESCRPKQQPGVVVVPIFSNVMAGQGAGGADCAHTVSKSAISYIE